MKKLIIVCLGLLAIPAIYYNLNTSPTIRQKGPIASQFWFSLQRTSGSGTLDYLDFDRTRKQAELLSEERNESESEGETRFNRWRLRGPTNQGGRVTDIVGDDQDSDKFYVATASGGVWKTTDGGDHFAPIFDDSGNPAIGALGIDPRNSDVLFVGTGEANPGGGSVAYPGNGVWKTTDGGTTWKHLGLNATRYIGQIVVDPSDSNTVFVAAMGQLFGKNPERGLYVTRDGGLSWKKSLYINPGVGVIDVSIDPKNPQNVFAASWERIRHPHTRVYYGPNSGVWRSKDGGVTWKKLGGGLPTGSLNRIGVAVSPAQPDVVYAVVTNSSGTLNGIYQSRNGGDSWSRQQGSGLGGLYSTYGWWFGRIFLHPHDADELWLPGIKLYRSTNGGKSFAHMASQTHVDHHTLWIPSSQPQIRILGNDGGIYQSKDGGNRWGYLAIPTMQFYTLEVDHKGRIMGGLQDNGTYATFTGTTNDWKRIGGGDGFTVLVDPNDDKVIYAESQYGAMGKSVNNGKSFSSCTNGVSGRKNWHTPFVIDPLSKGSSTVLYLGTHKLFRSTNAARNWTAVSGDLTNGDAGKNGVTFGTITSIDVAPSNQNTLYVGTDDGNIWVSTNRAVDFQKVSAKLPKRWVTRVTIDPKNDAVAYATFSGFLNGESLSHIYRTDNFGKSWKPISTNLPDAPVNDLLVDPKRPKTLYVGTDTGVYVSRNLGNSWAELGGGMPKGLIVSDLKLTTGIQRRLFAATYGRGIYSIDI